MPSDTEPLQIELIEWLDSVGHNNGRWGRLSEVREWCTPEGLRHESVGWVIFEDDVSLAFCGSRGLEAHNNGECNVCDVMQIPKAAILSRTILTPKR